MEIKVVTGSITEIKADAVVVGFFEGTGCLDGDIAALDKALGGAVSELISQGEIKGRLNEVTVIHSLGKLAAARAVVTGLGKPAELSRDRLCGAVAETCRRLRKMGAASIATVAQGAGVNDISPAASAQAIAEGALLGLYRFRRHMTGEADYGEIKEFTLVAADENERQKLESGCRRGRVLAEATNLARDMANEPANYMTPAIMAEKAKELAADCGLKCQVLEPAEMRKLGMGALLGVAQGSREPPRLIVLRYRGSGSAGVDLALVGKGITFDSGGISIKPSEKMSEMKGDMAGGAAVLAAMRAISRFQPKINVVALVPATENLPSGSALKPGDVITALGGKTIEVVNTDAEGRLVLADALGYALKLGAKSIIDIATLTGACHIALGDFYSGAFGNRKELMDGVLKAAAEAGEPTWQLPMHEQYKELNKSDVADIKNSGGRYGGAITAAQFLAEFVGDTPWVHLDIAGTFLSDKERGCLVKGATGVPVRTLVNLVLSLAEG
ncbi:MAG: leucyl aminopeptidase [Dehalococcoidales bacterium]|nr:leucyl aminopeptidase [Dehalococcoidales bacterium]